MDGLNPSHNMTEDDINDYKLQLPHGIGVKWKALARALGYKNATIEAIEKEKGCSIMECCIELLVGWLGREGQDATAGRLAEALEKIGLKNLADNLISGFSCCRCSCTNQRGSEDAKDATNKCDNIICELSDKLASLRKEVSRMNAENKELKEKLSIERQKCQETEQENQQLRARLELEDTGEHKEKVSQLNTTIEKLEEQLLIAKQKSHETEQENQKLRRARLEPENAREYEQEEDDFSTGTAQAAREYCVGVQLKTIREKLHEDVTSLLQMSEVKVKLDLLTKLSERLQNLYRDIQAMIVDTCKWSEDLKRDFCDFAYYGLRAEHNDLIHRVEDLESAQKGMSEEEKKALKILQGLQVNRQKEVDKLDELEGLFKLPERLPRAPMSEPFAADKQSNGKKVKPRHTDPGARPKKPNTREEVTAPTTSNDGKSDEVCLKIIGKKSKFESLRRCFRRKESDKNQCFGISFTPRRDS